MPTPTRRIARRLTALGLTVGLAAVVVSTTLASGANGSWDLSNTTLGYSPSNVVGLAPRGVVFDVAADTPVSALGIRARFDEPTTLTVEVREVSGTAPPATAPLASGSLDVPRSGMDVRTIPLPQTVTLRAGHRYDVRFQAPGGWMLGPNWVDQQGWGNPDFNSAKFFSPEQGSPFTVLAAGGGFDATYTYARSSLPHVYVVGAALDPDPPLLDVTTAPGDAEASTGWYNAASSGDDGVRLEVTATDASPLKWVRCLDRGQPVLDTTASVSTIELGDGFHSVTCSASDANGNIGATDGATSVRVDQTPPTLAPVVDPNPVREGQFAEAFAKATDAFGVDATCDPVSTRQVGHHSVTCRADDPAGNTATADAGYDVEYAFDGFFSPVQMGATNRAKAGSSVPLKFSIGGDDGMDVLAGGSPSVQACGGGDATRADGKLSYDSDAGQYVYVWKTDRAWAGSCREVTVRLVDGSAKSVSFRMS